MKRNMSGIQLLLFTVILMLVQPASAQNVKLAKIALGMSEAEVRTALAANAPVYVSLPSDSTDLSYLVAETEAESYAFTWIEGRLEAFSVVHILPPGQQPFLPAGQRPTVSILRGLISKQTRTPAEIRKGDTWWFSDISGAPLADASRCRPQLGVAWLPLGPVVAAQSGAPAPESTAGLMKPSLVAYPSHCGVSIHLNQTPAESEDSVVTAVRYQVLDIKALNAYLAKHHRH